MGSWNYQVWNCTKSLRPQQVESRWHKLSSTVSKTSDVGIQRTFNNWKLKACRLTNTERLGLKCSWVHLEHMNAISKTLSRSHKIKYAPNSMWTKYDQMHQAPCRGSLTVSTSAPASKSAAKCRTSPSSAATRSRSERVGRLRPNFSQATWSNSKFLKFQCFNTFWYASIIFDQNSNLQFPSVFSILLLLHPDSSPLSHVPLHMFWVLYCVLLSYSGCTATRQQGFQMLQLFTKLH